MKNVFLIISCIIIFICGSCSKRSVPAKEAEKPAVTSVSPKPAPLKIKKLPAPKVIAVNDAVAQKSVDGRLYYDLEGHRYWRSKADGKYYKYYRGMFDDAAFKP